MLEGKRLRLGQPDMGELGVGEGDARDDAAVLLRRQAKQQRADDDAGVIGGDMGELRRAGNDVADRIDPGIAGAQLWRNGDAGRLVPDAGLVEVEPGDVGGAAGGDQQMRRLDAAGAGIHVDADADPAAALDPLDPGGLADRHAVGAHALQHDRGKLGILPAKVPSRPRRP